jgi:putative aldouronate transport system substrate-binding protein
MNKRKIIRILSFVLVTAMAVTMIAGCSSDKNDSAVANSTSGQDTTAQQKEGPSYSWDTSPITLDWYMDYDWYGGKWYADAPIPKKITELTGVTINFIAPPAGSADQKLNTMIAADDLNDIMTMGADTNALKTLIATKKIAPLLQTAEQYAPTFRDIIPQSLIDTYKKSDGELYQIPGGFLPAEYYEGTTPDISNNTFMVARKDIMDQLGIKAEDFNTQEGTIAALEKVQSSNVTYKGKKVYPLYVGADGGINDTFDWMLPNMFGIPFETKDGKYQDRKLDPKFFETIQFGNRLVTKGLISKENFTEKRTQIETKIKSGQVFALLANGGDFNGSCKELFVSDKTCDWTVVGPVRAKDNAQPLYDSATLGWLATTLSAKSPKLERAARFLEFWWSEKGQELANFGIEGVTFEKNGVNGHYKWTEAYDKDSKADAQAAEKKYGFGQFWIMTNNGSWNKYNPVPTAPEDVLVQNFYDAGKKYIYVSNAFGMNMGPEAGTEEANIVPQLDQYWDQQMTSMLLAKSDDELKKTYDKAIEHYKELGAEKVVAVKDASFQKNKISMGIKFVTPIYK